MWRGCLLLNAHIFLTGAHHDETRHYCKYWHLNTLRQQIHGRWFCANDKHCLCDGDGKQTQNMVVEHCQVKFHNFFIWSSWLKSEDYSGHLVFFIFQKLTMKFLIVMHKAMHKVLLPNRLYIFHSATYCSALVQAFNKDMFVLERKRVVLLKKTTYKNYIGCNYQL